MAERGLRSSCEIIAMNSSLRRSDSRIASSAPLRRVMSVQTPIIRDGRPCPSANTFPLPMIQCAVPPCALLLNSAS